MRDKKLNFLIQSAIFAAIIAVLAQLAIPMPSGVPITLQTFAVSLCAFFLGPIQAAVSVLIYIGLGAIGLPVFSNLHGGIGFLTGATGGFIAGFIPMALLCGTSKLIKIDRILKPSNIIRILPAIFLSLIGLALCHLMGAWHFSNFTKKDFVSVLPLVSYPFIIKDVLSVIAAYFLSTSIRNRLIENP